MLILLNKLFWSVLNVLIAVQTSPLPELSSGMSSAINFLAAWAFVSFILITIKDYTVHAIYNWMITQKLYCHQVTPMTISMSAVHLDCSCLH